MLRELSLRFHDAWIHVWDPDGEFLAVEAADRVPRWLTPENDANRVCQVTPLVLEAALTIT